MSTRKKQEARPGPLGGARDTNRKRRTAQLLEAGLDLFLAHGIEAVTIDDLVAKAEVAKGSFYRYFEDKTALVDALFAPLGERFSSAFTACEKALRAADSRESLGAAYQLLAEQIGAEIVASPREVRLYLQENRAPASGARAPIRRLADEFRARALDLTRVAHERGLLRPFDGRVSALAVAGAVEALLFAVLQGEDLGNPLAIPDALVSLVLDGLRPRDPL